MSEARDNLCLIPARGGSRGVPGKNVRPLGGIPLFAHSIVTARASGVFEDVYVSTEDPRIAEIAVGYGARVIERPSQLATDDAPMAPVIEHAIETVTARARAQPQNLFLLEPTSPLRNAEDIQRAAAILAAGDCDAVMGVFEADDPPQWSLHGDDDGLLRPLHRRAECLARRQDLEPAYFGGPVYAIATETFLQTKSFLTERTRFFVVPPQRAVDIDTDFDFDFAEFLLARSELCAQPHGSRPELARDPEPLSPPR